MQILVDYLRFQENIDNYIKINDEMKKMLEEIKNKTDNLKDYWDSKTSSQVFEEFNNFSSSFQEKIDKNEENIVFLRDVVKKSYIELENKKSSEIENRLAIK